MECRSGIGLIRHISRQRLRQLLDMRRPSRFMPKFTRRWRWSAAVALAILAFAPVYLFLNHPVGMSVVVGAFVALAVTEHYRQKARLRRLVQSRRGESICEFARSFERHHVDTWVIRAVYEQFQEYLGGNPPMPIRAADRLKDDLPLDMEDVELDIALQISQRTGRLLSNTIANPYYAKVKTVEDLVLFFNAQPRVTELVS
jgi:hypothetical protein